MSFLAYWPVLLALALIIIYYKGRRRWVSAAGSAVNRLPSLNLNLAWSARAFWKSLQTMGVILAAILAAWVAYLLVQNGWDYELPSVPGVPLILVIAVLAALPFVVLNVDRKKLYAVLLRTATILLVYAIYELYSHNTIGIGLRREFLYLVAIGLLLIAWTYLKGWDRALMVALLIFGFVMLGFSHKNTWQEFVVWRPWNSSGTTVASAPANPQCPAIKQTVTFGHTPIWVNPKANCSVDIWSYDHCIYVRRAASTNDPKPYRVCNGEAPRDIEWVWTADISFDGDIALVPRRY